ncbi:hypothetical protein BGX38DRAFT_1160476 [Terfezia claveryi]|nr:hypothetical protein BGX38DRAFT_1160476 [Terfezia claveryi]
MYRFGTQDKSSSVDYLETNFSVAVSDALHWKDRQQYQKSGISVMVYSEGTKTRLHLSLSHRMGNLSSRISWITRRIWDIRAFAPTNRLSHTFSEG